MFDPTKKHHNPKNSFDLYDETRHVTWESADSNNMWPLKQPPFVIEDDETELKPEPRWGMNSPHYRSLSPVSRTEAIIRGQKELMEMVRNMPESNYELSLKDLVEHHHRDVFTTTEENYNNTEDEKKMMTTKKKVDDDKKIPAAVKRNEKVDHGGFYLKVALPFISLGSNKEKKKKKKESKVSPRPSISDGSVKEKEWWKKSTPLVYKESDDSAAESSIVSNGSLKSSISSSSKSSSSKSRSSRSRRITSNSSRRENSRGGCWTMFRKSKNQKKRVKD